MIALLALSLVWGYNWVVMKQALHHAGPWPFTALRTGLGAVALFVVLAVLRRPLRPRQPLLTALLGAAGMRVVGLLLVASLLVECEAPGCKKLSREIRLIDGLSHVEFLELVLQDELAVRSAQERRATVDEALVRLQQLNGQQQEKGAREQPHSENFFHGTSSLVCWLEFGYANTPSIKTRRRHAPLRDIGG